MKNHSMKMRLQVGCVAVLLALTPVARVVQAQPQSDAQNAARIKTEVARRLADKKTKEDGSRWCFRVVAADYVTTDSGTGIVHQAPAFGEDDYQVGLREGLPVIRPMGLTGIFDERVTD